MMTVQGQQSSVAASSDAGKADALADRSGALRVTNGESVGAAGLSTAGPTKRMRPCRFWGSESGCRAGKNCPFFHDAESPPLQPSSKSPLDIPDGPSSTLPPPANVSRGPRRQAVTKPVASSRVVAKPIPKAQDEDPREFQLGQIRRRYKPRESRVGDATVLDFSLKPSDPDFPFEMDALLCCLSVPTGFPAAQPSLRVKNKDIPRGFAINIENGFQGLVEERKEATLLALLSALDKNLEAFLSEKKAETIKLVANADRRHLDALPVRSKGPVTVPAPSQPSAAQPSKAIKPMEFFTAAQKADAKQRREAETRQLEARLGRLPLYKKSGDGIAYTVPIEPRRRLELPLSLRAIKTVKLFVPLLYPLQGCRVKLEGVDDEDAQNTELAFEERAKVAVEMSLMGHINYLAQNLHLLAKTVQPKPEPISQPVVEHLPEIAPPPPVSRDTDDDRSHIIVIPRPPEWTMIDGPEDSDSDEYSYDTGDETSSSNDHEDDPSDPPDPSSSTPQPTSERGTSLSFPFLELRNIELLELHSLNLTIKCTRCRTPSDMRALKDQIPQTIDCRKCATLLSITYRKELMHMSSVRAGFLDLQACTVVDFLPSSFLPTCASCSNTVALPGVSAVRGDTVTHVCRSCHTAMTLSIPSSKFLLVSHDLAPARRGVRKSATAALGIVSGSALPDRGSCTHYSKSYRWFRFSCCGKVFACDRCHDAAETHPNEHADRMICGWCSREQNYRPVDCGFCGRSCVRKSSGGFWEGGRGTRDRVKMSRKDGRKYRRVGGSAKKT